MYQSLWEAPVSHLQPHVGSDHSNFYPKDHDYEWSMLTSRVQCLAKDILSRMMLCAEMSGCRMVVGIPYPREIKNQCIHSPKQPYALPLVSNRSVGSCQILSNCVFNISESVRAKIHQGFISHILCLLLQKPTGMCQDGQCYQDRCNRL